MDSFYISLVGLALADSVNPCCINALLVMLTLNIIKGDKRRALLSGLAFTIGIITGYMLLGAALLWGFTLIPPHLLPYLNLIVGGAGIVVAFLTFADAIKGASGLTPEGEKGVIRRYLDRATSPLPSLIVGFILSFLLLPCSMGPYIVFTVKLSSFTPRVALQILLLFVYNIIFSVPFWGMTLFAYLVGSVLHIKKLKRSILPYLEAGAGVLLMIIAYPLFRDGLWGVLGR